MWNRREIRVWWDFGGIGEEQEIRKGDMIIDRNPDLDSTA